MFDAESRGRSALAADKAANDQANLDAICARYDALINNNLQAVTDDDVRDLAALAGIFDLDTQRPLEAMWPEVRAVLTAQSPRVVEAPAAAVTQALTLLVVEDDPEMAQDLTALLVEAGHSVVGPFHNAEAAEVAAGLHAIDVALLDINLSGATDGGALGRGLKSRWGIKIVFLSGDVSAAAGHAEIAEAMIFKPYGGADVLAALQRISEATAA